MAHADFFLANAQPAPGDLLVLDFEMNNQGPSMTLQMARDFASHVKDVHGVWPASMAALTFKELLAGNAGPALTHCWLWLAQYGPDSILPPGWDQWTLWQYTDGHVGPGPYQVAGVQQCGRELLRGSPDDLNAFWQ